MNEKTAPTVSIVMCAYNAGKYIDETIASVLVQTFTDFEVIIVNDGSTDNTVEIVKAYGDPRIVLIEQQNGGPSVARNTALQHATGKFIAILDSDDLWFPLYLETMLNIFKSDPGIDFAYPNAELFGTPYWNGKFFMDRDPSSLPITLDKLISRECNVFISSIFKREIITKVGGFDTSLKGSEDLDLWFRICQAGYQFTFTREVLVKYRKRDDSLSSGSENFYKNVIAAVTKLKLSGSLTKQQQQLADNYVKRVQAEDYDARFHRQFAARNFQAAAADLHEVIARQPSFKRRLIAFCLQFFPGLLFKAVSLKSQVLK